MFDGVIDTHDHNTGIQSSILEFQDNTRLHVQSEK
mgnify:CR=1 FL=1|jgi:hypothetical protein